MKKNFKEDNALTKNEIQSNKAELINWIKKNGIHNKLEFTKHFPKELYSKIKFKWNQVWNPDLKKGNWTDFEDLCLFASYIKNEGSWSEISKDLQNRTRISIRNRFVNSFKSKTLLPNKDLFRSLVLGKQLNYKGIKEILVKMF
jgi:hypothetical protein